MTWEFNTAVKRVAWSEDDSKVSSEQFRKSAASYSFL